MCNCIWLITPCSRVRPLHDAVLNRLTVIGLSSRNIEVTNERVDLIARQIKSPHPGSARVSLNERWDVESDGNHLWWRDKEIKSQTATPLHVPLLVPGETIIEALSKVVLLEDCREDPPASFPGDGCLEALVDFSELPGEIVLRRRQTGDYIQPFGRDEKVSLKKFLHTRKASAHVQQMRASLDPQWSVSQCVVLAIGAEVLWIPGVGLSERLRVQEKPTHRLAVLPLTNQVRKARDTREIAH